MASFFKILQLNVRSLKSNLVLIESLIHKENIDVAIFSETWLLNDETIKVKNYDFFKRNRADGYGGVGILVKSKFNATEFSIDLNPIEYIEINIKQFGNEHKFISIYIPPNISNKNLTSQLSNLFSIVENKSRIFLGGDFNGHHKLWDKSKTNNARGKLIANKLIETNMFLLNDGHHTYQNIQNHSFSAIDLSIISNDYSNNVDWKVLDDNVGSDHLPIVCKIGRSDQLSPTKVIKKINIPKLTELISNTDFSIANDIESFEEILTNKINECTHIFEVKNKHVSKPWWTDRIKNLWIVKQNKQRIYFKNKTLFTAIELKKAIAMLKLEIKKQKQLTWNTFIEDINPTHTLKSIYKKINLFNPAKKRGINNAFLDSNDKLKQLLENSYVTNNNYSLINQTLLTYNSDILNYNDLKEIINDSKNTAAGINNISNQVLKLLNDDQIKILTYLIQTAFNKQEFPKQWHNIKAITFVKPGKDSSHLENYRIISLLNVIHKVFNKYLKNIFNSHINTYNLLPNNSFGFRKGVGTSEFMVNLVKHIEENQKNKFITVILSIDLQKAFDMVNIQILIQKMKNMRFESKYLFWISEMLLNRKVKLKINDASADICLNQGVPQGDVLSPMLFNLYTAEIHELQSNNVIVLQYADDFTFLIRGLDSTSVNLETNRLLYKLNIILNTLDLKLNSNKCKFMCNNFNKNFTPLNIEIDNKKIKEELDLKILGTYIDNKLRFVKNVREIKDTCMKYINILKIFNNRKGGAHPKTLLNAYNALVKSRVCFGSVATKTECKKSVKIIQTLINAALRNVMGYTRTTPITTILAETTEVPFEYIQEQINIKFICKHLSLNTDIGLDIKNSKSITSLNKTFSKYPLLIKISKKIVNIERPRNLIINENIPFYQKLNSGKINLKLTNNIINSNSNYFSVFTDASIIDESVGAGIYFKNTGEKIKYKIKHNVSIKTAEIFAIFMALKLSIAMKQINIIVYTDSKSSCISIKNSVETLNDKLYENEIIKLLNDNKPCNIIIQWVPAHIGVLGNEIADSIAKDAVLNENLEVEIKMPSEDIQRICLNELILFWKDEYTHKTQHKGRFNANIIQSPKKHVWFTKSKFSNKHIKILNRLRSGHAFDKKFKHLMKIENNNICERCNTVEDIIHIIENCNKYTTLRNKFTLINTKGLINILKDEIASEYRILMNFIDEAQIQL